jgi:hypothetical protein
LPTLLVYRSALPQPQRFELAFLLATALPLLVALSEIGLQSGIMLPQNAAALVGAGVLSVLVFPAVAVGIGRRVAHLLTQSLVPGYDVARTDGSLPAAHCVGASRLELLTPSL